jgi:hypothetical protein
MSKTARTTVVGIGARQGQAFSPSDWEKHTAGLDQA